MMTKTKTCGCKLCSESAVTRFWHGLILEERDLTSRELLEVFAVAHDVAMENDDSIPTWEEAFRSVAGSILAEGC